MALTLIQAGTSLQMMDASGAFTTLTLPTGITLNASVPPRFALYGRYVVMVNSPNRPITIDPLGKVRVLVPFPPSSALTLASGGSGGLTGAYKAKQTFTIRDTYGNIISESDFGPAMKTAFTAAANDLATSGINLSGDDITGSNLYRTVAGGEVYFKWRELDGNTQTTCEDDNMADLSLEIFTAPTLGTPPDLSIVAEWRGRLWGVSKVDFDILRYTEAGTMYAWNGNNQISVPRIGADTRGVVSLITRRDSLVAGRRNNIQQVTGTSNADFRIVKLSDQVGIESNESVAIYKETAFFLWKDGVYTLDADGVTCISDKAGVRKWFTTSDYFNTSRFQYAVGLIDPVRLKYKLFLSAAGSSDLDRWVEYDLREGTWWGPHKTGAFTPVSAFTIYDANDNAKPVIGGSTGYVWQEQTGASDDTATAIDFDVDTNWNHSNSPEIDKFHGRIALIGKVQTAGNLTVTPYISYLNAAAGNPFYYVMSKGKQLLGRLGLGKMFRLNLRHNVAAEPVELYGYDVDDIHELGKR